MKHGFRLRKWEIGVIDEARSKGMTLEGIALKAGVPSWDLYSAYSGRNAVGKSSFLKIKDFIYNHAKLDKTVDDYITGK